MSSRISRRIESTKECHQTGRSAGRSRSDQRKPAKMAVEIPPRSKSALRGPDEAKCKIQVALRMRPFAEHERRDEALAIEGSKVQLIINNIKYCFEFAHVFGAESSQEDVYRRIAMPLLTHMLAGINVCLFAYGQTGSGKTYSIVGDHDNPGILRRFTKDLFYAVTEVKPEERRLTVSFYEIYQEKAYDLLGDVRKALKVRGGEEAYVSGLTVAHVSDFANFELLRQRAWTKRVTASTSLNRQSSRSHVIVHIIYQRTISEKAGDKTRSFAITSHVYFVDLAGAERVVESCCSHIEETIAINVSLSALHRVVFSATDGVQCGFRDSILTRLLKDCLVGNARTVMLATVSPSTDFIAETLSTLRFATQAALLTLRPRVNVDPSLELYNDVRSENEELKKRLASVEASRPTVFILPKAPCVIELQRDPALTTWTPLIKELAFSPCGIAEMVVGFNLNANKRGAMVEAYGDGVYLNGETLVPRHIRPVSNADRVVIRDERFFLILLDENDENNILIRHSFSSIRLEFIESNFERLRKEVATDKRIDAKREKMQLMEEIDEELKLRKEELEKDQYKTETAGGTRQAKENTRLAQLHAGLENLLALRESFTINANRIIEDTSFEVASFAEKELLMDLKSEVDRANFIIRRFEKENIYDFKLKVLDVDGTSKPCVRLTDKKIKMYSDLSSTEFTTMAERLLDLNVACTMVTEEEKQRMGEVLFQMCRELPNLVKMGGGRPSNIMHTAIVNSTNEAAHKRRTTAAEFRKSLVGAKRSTFSSRLFDVVEEKDEEGSAFERQFVRSVQYLRKNRKEKRGSGKGGYVSVLLDVLADMHNDLPTLRSIDKGVIKGMPFFTSIDAFAQLAAQLDVMVATLSSNAGLPPDAEPSAAEVVVELRHLLTAFDSWLSNFEDDDTEIRGLVLDSMKGMFGRIFTALGKAAFWMDERLGDKQLSQEMSEAYAIGLLAAVDEVCEENEDINRRFSAMPSVVSQIITKTSEALREACRLYKEAHNERLLFGAIRPLFLILHRSGRFSVDIALQQLMQIMSCTMNSSIPRAEPLIASIHRAIQRCSGGSAAFDPQHRRPPTRPCLPVTPKNARCGGMKDI